MTFVLALPVLAVSLDKVDRVSLTMPQQYELDRLPKIYRNRVEVQFQPASSHTKSVFNSLINSQSNFKNPLLTPPTLLYFLNRI
ncbi:hypothetical protein MICAI_1340006 [Microcystis sp. T1-4]|nr:hypothetical protein MICAI_1340006 [Microcystis sp. T1-4]